MRTTFVDELFRALYVAFLDFTHFAHFVLGLISLFILQRFKNRLFSCYQVYFYMEMAMSIWLQAKYTYFDRFPYPENPKSDNKYELIACDRSRVQMSKAIFWSGFIMQN